MTVDEYRLIQELKSGRSAAYKTLFDQYYSLLVSYSLKYQNDVETAREIVHQLFQYWDYLEEEDPRRVPFYVASSPGALLLVLIHFWK